MRDEQQEDVEHLIQYDDRLLELCTRSILSGLFACDGQILLEMRQDISICTRQLLCKGRDMNSVIGDVSLVDCCTYWFAGNASPNGYHRADHSPRFLLHARKYVEQHSQPTFGLVIQIRNILLGLLPREG